MKLPSSATAIDARTPVSRTASTAGVKSRLEELAAAAPVQLELLDSVEHVLLLAVQVVLRVTLLAPERLELLRAANP